MTLVYRSVKGSNLIASEIDGNFHDLDDRVNAIETGPDTAISIVSASIIGNQLTFTLSDASTIGPLTVPTATWSFAGAWAPATVYTPFKVVTNGGSTYLVLFAHTSAASFDPNANDGMGHNYYGLIQAPPTQPNDLHAFVGGIMSDDQLILRYQTTRRWALPAGLVGSYFTATDAATDDAVIELRKNGSVIGSLTYVGGGALHPTIDFVGVVSFDPGDNFEVVLSGLADLTLSDVTLDFLGNRIP